MEKLVVSSHTVKFDNTGSKNIENQTQLLSTCRVGDYGSDRRDGYRQGCIRGASRKLDQCPVPRNAEPLQLNHELGTS